VSGFTLALIAPSGSATIRTEDILFAIAQERISQTKQLESATALALRLTEEAAPSTILDVIALQLRAMIDTGNSDKTKRLLDAARALCATSGDASRKAFFDHAAARAKFFSGDDDRARAEAEHALNQQRDLISIQSDSASVGRYFVQLIEYSIMLEGSGRPDLIVATTRRAEEIFANSGLPAFYQFDLSLRLAKSAAVASDPENASRQLDRLVEQLSPTEYHVLKAEALGMRTDVALLQGSPRDALRFSVAEVAAQSRAQNRPGLASARLVLARIHSALGDFKDAFTEADQARAMFDALDDPAVKASARIVMAQAAARQGTLKQAKSLLKEAHRLYTSEATDWKLRIKRVEIEILAREGPSFALQAAIADEADLRAADERARVATQTQALRKLYQDTDLARRVAVMERDSLVTAKQLEAKSAALRLQRLIIVGCLLLVASISVATLLFVRRNRELRRANNTDSLTEVRSRKAIMKLAWDTYAQALRRSQYIAICAIDIDGFKAFNDEHGHATGDQVLRHVAHTIASSLRSSDVLGRIGGDEFLIVMKRTDEERALQVAERVLGAIAKLPVSIADRSVFLNISVGVAASVADEVNIASATALLVEKADFALLAAKRAGKNCAVAYSSLERSA
jgi:diguanylate cyclase (GGDEF)-like protein